MKASSYSLLRYEAEEGKVFDWAEPHIHDIKDEQGNTIDKEIEHLYAKVLFLGDNDKIENYIEVDQEEK